MVKTVLKEFFACHCEGAMFAHEIDKENEKVTYKCIRCGATMEKSFDEVKLSENDRTDYFVLNDDGVVTWKCFEHGYCEFRIEDLWWEDRLPRFVDLGCGLGKYPEEIEAEMEVTDEDETIVKNIIESLTHEQLAELSENMGVEDFEGDPITAETYMIYYRELAGYGEFEGFGDFLETLKSTIFDLFEIEYDEEGNVFNVGE